MAKLSIIILSHNTKELLGNCLNSIVRVKNEANIEVIVVDNASEDGSIELVESYKSKLPKLTLLKKSRNLGYSKGNNSAKSFVNGEYILFLNSDTEVYKDSIKKTLEYMENNPEVGALTCKIVIPSGELDKDARRSFPTPWVAFTHLSGLDRLFPKSKTFAKYHYGYKDANLISEIDVLEGAFFLVRHTILDKVGWFDEDYFLNGEDIDLSWKIKKLGWKIIYYPKVKILHVKKGTKRMKKLKYVTSGVDAMKLFYNKHLRSEYPFYINIVVSVGLYLLKAIRIINYYVFKII